MSKSNSERRSGALRDHYSNKCNLEKLQSKKMVVKHLKAVLRHKEVIVF